MCAFITFSWNCSVFIFCELCNLVKVVGKADNFKVLSVVAVLFLLYLCLLTAKNMIILQD